jgi:hypothetical protein
MFQKILAPIAGNLPMEGANSQQLGIVCADTYYTCWEIGVERPRSGRSTPISQQV